MSARDDYPADGGVIDGTAELYDGKYEQMCDEIDRLRAENCYLTDRVIGAYAWPADGGSRGNRILHGPSPLDAVRAAITELDAAYARREHGGVAQGHAIDTIRAALKEA